MTRWDLLVVGTYISIIYVIMQQRLSSYGGERPHTGEREGRACIVILNSLCVWALNNECLMHAGEFKAVDVSISRTGAEKAESIPHEAK